MKTLLVLITLAMLTSTAFANHGNRNKGKVVVAGDKAELIYNTLNTDIVTKSLPKFTAEIKKVASLKCAKLTKKADTAVVKFRCSLRGKKVVRRGAGNRHRGNRGDRAGRGNRGHRRGGNGRGHGELL